MENLDVPEISGYQLHDLIFQGGMGCVFRAIQLSTNRPVAIKQPLGDRGLEEFDREIEFASRVQHEFVVPVYHANDQEDSGPLFLAMRLVLDAEGNPSDGLSFLIKLVKVVNKSHTDPSEHCRKLLPAIRAVADAIHAVHKSEIIHGDVKLQNLLEDEFGKLHLTDFGLADNTNYKVFENGGTPFFVAPEQSAGRPTQKSDVYSLGVTLALLLGTCNPERLKSGIDALKRRRSTNDSEDVGETIRELSRPQNPGTSLWTLPSSLAVSSFCADAPKYLRWIVDNATLHDTEKRLDSQQLVDHLNRFVTGNPCPSDPFRLVKAGWLWTRRRWPWLATGLMIMAFMIVFFLNSWHTQKRKEELVRADYQGREELVSQAEQLLRDGLSSKTRPVLEKAMEGIQHDSPLKWKVLYLRSQVGELELQELLAETALLLDSHEPSEPSYTELLFLHADLASCNEDLRNEFDWRGTLEEIDLNKLPLADQYYVRALLAANLLECEEQLIHSLQHRQFHDRASVLFAALNLSQGRLTQTIRFCTAQENAKPDDGIYKLIRLGAEMLLAQTSPDKLSATDFPKSTNPQFLIALRRLLPSYKSENKSTEPQNWQNSNISIRAQIGFAQIAQEFISSIPEALQGSPIPIHILDKRVAEWKTIENLLAETSDADFSPESLAKIERIATNDPDGFGKLLMSMKLSFEITAAIASNHYKETGAAVFDRFLNYQRLTANSETLIPSQPIRFFVLFLQMTAELASIHEVELDNLDIRRSLRSNVKIILRESQNVPTHMREQILQMLFKSLNASIQQEDSAEKKSHLVGLALIMLDDWIESYPEDPTAFLFRASLLFHIGQRDAAQIDLTKLLVLDPDNADALQLADQLKGDFQNQ